MRKKTISIEKITPAKEQSQKLRLAQDFHLLSLLQFVAPSIVMMLFMGFYTIGDTAMVSRFIHTNALSAVNIVCPVINLIVGLGTMVATGGSAIIARKMGSGNEKEACRNLTLLILTGILLGILLAVVGIFFLDHIIRGLGASRLLYPYCRDYLFVLLLFTPASMLQVLFQTLLITAGHPGYGMLLSVSAGIANLLLDYLFMVPLDMGIAGSALGTGIGYLLPAGFGLVFFIRTKGTLRFCRPLWDFGVIRESCLNGSSEMVSQAASAVTTFLFNRVMMKHLGENGVAAITILIYSQFLLTTLYIGFSMGAAPIISYNYGSGNRPRLRKVLRLCLAFLSVASVLLFVLSFTCASGLVGIFCPRESDVYKIALDGFSIFSFSFLLCGFNIFTSAVFTALSNGKTSALLSFLRTFGFITAGLIVLPWFLGIPGVWLAVPLAEAATLVIALICLSKEKAFLLFTSG
ncbi:MATE family efflux transporter [Lachnospiraceae bacterium ASD3451]|uniref:MATE family efflux transporter n=1 Tax=Diplocloster agilis TaxID=2850323 RepID=UPI001D36428D|nr:MATE family efflux transporter [Diplocloster agilis]MBU9744009.1 MATE family efflux transporter [Diplocloster agilis]